MEKYKQSHSIVKRHSCPVEQSHWVKLFVGGTFEVEAPGITWRNTRLDGMGGVLLQMKHTDYVLKDPYGEERTFWQSDDYEAKVGQPATRVRRRIQMQIDEGWLTIEVEENDSQHRIYIADRRI